MKNYLQQKIKKIPRYFWILLMIILVGIFFRAYHYNDWLQFRTDEYRDALLVSHAVEGGPGFLPLVGPRAGGTQLHIGPIFYYFQYISGVIFQSTSPVSYAFPDLLFSVLSIPLFFIFLRFYFSPRISLALTAMLATCFMAIEHGRFAWNPNSTPFFTILFLYALLKVYLIENSKTNKFIWFLILGISFSIATQLHFSVFLGLPIIAFLFVLLEWKRSKEILTWKNCLVFFVPIVILYLPYIINEVVTHGYNAAQFFDVIRSKGSGQGIKENIVQNINMFSKYFLYIAYGVVDGKLWQNVASGMFFLAMFVVNIFLFLGEKNANKKQFLQISVLMLLVYFLIFTPLAVEIDRTRFFLPLLIFPFIFVGYAIVFLQKKGFIRTARFGGALLVAIIILSNVRATLTWFSNLDFSQKIPAISDTNEDFLLTWGNFKLAATYVDNNCKEETIFLFTSKKVKKYNHSIEYAINHINRKLVVELPQEDYNRDSDDNFKGCYLFVSQIDADLPGYVTQEPHDKNFVIGNMQITRWYPMRAMQASIADNEEEMPMSLEKLIAEHARISWRDLLQ